MVSDSAELLAALDDDQRRAAEALLGPVCVLAGAGTGKTRALTTRIAYGVASGVYDPSRVMALTFTSRAAGELRTRLRTLGAGAVSARTFHAAALAQLTHFWPQVIGGTAPGLLEGKGRVLGQAADELRIRVDTAALRDTASEIEWRKVSRLSLDEYAVRAATRPMPPGVDAAKMVDLHRAYERIKDERRRIDFEDVLLATAGMIETEPVVAEQVRAQYRFFVVDEYQDVSPLQQELLDLWLGPRTDLCVVGDANQTIYSFTGATSDYLLGFASRYDDAEVVRLERNYRSRPAILRVANQLMRGRPGALELVPADAPDAAGEPAGSAPSSGGAAAGRPAGPAGRAPRAAAASRPAAAEPGVVPEPIPYPSDAEEARGVAEAVAAEITAGTRPERIAVLYRVNAQAALLEQAFAAAGVATRQLGATRFFDLEIIKRAVLELRSVARTGPAQPLFQSVSDVVRGLGWTLEAPAGQGAVRERWDALSALVELADQAGSDATLTAFVDELQQRQASQHEPTMPTVVLATLHSAKGLEWESVHLIGLTEGLLPLSHAKGLAAIDEERRLLYVGITRARRRLALSWSASGMRGQRREPSRFLAELRTRTPDAVAPRTR